MPHPFTPELQGFIHSQRVGRLATADRNGEPHLVPVCFAYDGTSFYIVIDQKPKRVSPLRLRRVRNIVDNPRVALLLDHYEESWECLGYLFVQGTAQIIQGGPEWVKALRLLQEKYPQYRQMDLEGAPMIQITVDRFVSWGALEA